MHHMEADEAYREKARRKLHKNVTSCIEQIQEATSHGYQLPISLTIQVRQEK